MPTRDYRENHYVPQWYQERFLPATDQRVFQYLDLTPETVRTPNGRIYTRRDILPWGTVRCFKETDLYTVKFGRFESTEIEQFFFGKVDAQGKKAVECFSVYNGAFNGWPRESKPSDMFNALLNYMSVQKFRTPKGLRYLATLIATADKNQLLFQMQRWQNLHCAIWTECVWALVDANTTRTKFLISDHPVTVYNRGVFPDSEISRTQTDPDFRMNGTHTLFPLSPTRILILTNLSWARNPYGNGIAMRPNPRVFRSAMFNFTEIQTGRELNEVEVNQINFIIKRRAQRYVAAAERDWLYPEKVIPSTHWRKLDDRYLLMPDPRSLTMGGEILIGYEGGRSEAFDEYGRRPWQRDYKSEPDSVESRTLYAFQGEFARLFGRRRRGCADNFGGRGRRDEDSEDFHQYHLDSEKKHWPRGFKALRDRRAERIR